MWAEVLMNPCRAASVLSVLLTAMLLPNFCLAANNYGKSRSEIYSTYCADCHGVSGISTMPSIPNFTQNESLAKPNTQLFDVINNGKGAMPLFRGILTELEILDMIDYIRTLN